MYRPAQSLMDLETVIFVMFSKGGLNVTGCSGINSDRPIECKGVAEGVVIVTQRCYPTDNELGVLSNADIIFEGVPFKWVTFVKLEEADAVRVYVRCF